MFFFWYKREFRDIVSVNKDAILDLDFKFEIF
jgi:hypothetical protein